MKVVLLGSKGYLGGHLLSVYPQALTPSVDIADPSAVAAMLDAEKPDLLINAAGKTGRPNVDWCEDHKEETLRSNVTGPLVLLHECLKRGVYWIHFSSGCIYEGDNGGRGFTEDDAPNFAGSYYSRSKAVSEQLLKDFPVLILRPRMPFDGSGHARNLLRKLMRYSSVLDEPNSLTYIPDMLAAIRTLVDRKATGIYNLVNPGAMSPYNIMERYRALVDPAHAVQRLTVSTLPGVVKAGRSNCILSSGKLEREGIRMRPVREVVDEALQNMMKNIPVATPA